MYDIEVKVSLKPGMLNPEATTIQRWKLTQKMMQEKKWMTCVKNYYAIQLSTITQSISLRWT